VAIQFFLGRWNPPPVCRIQVNVGACVFCPFDKTFFVSLYPDGFGWDVVYPPPFPYLWSASGVLEPSANVLAPCLQPPHFSAFLPFAFFSCPLFSALESRPHTNHPLDPFFLTPIPDSTGPPCFVFAISVWVPSVLPVEPNDLLLWSPGNGGVFLFSPTLRFVMVFPTLECVIVFSPR